jgi:hypothetical protein
MAPTSQAVPSQMETRPRNKTTHPGKVTKTSAPRRTSAEVQKEREAKAKAKADREEAKKRSIIRAAEFEHADMANEDMVDATPRPPFTPKPWPPPRNRKKVKPVPNAESSEVEIGDDNLDLDFDKTSLTPVPSDDSITEDESDDPTPPAKKQKIQATEKATRTAGASAKVAAKKKKVDRDEEVVATSDEEQTPKPKKVQAKVRDEINFAVKKMENEVKGNKYGDMVKSMSSTNQAERSGVPAPKAPSQLQAAGGGGKKLKREGAIADINALVTPASANPDQNDIRNNNDLMDIDNR